MGKKTAFLYYYFLKSYDQDSIEIQNKAKSLLFFNLAIITLILIILIYYLIFASSTQMIVMAVIGLIIHIITLTLLKYHKIIPGSNLLIFTMFANMSSIGFINLGENPLLGFYVGTIMLVFTLLATVLLHIKNYQYIIINIASPVVIIMQFLVKVLLAQEASQINNIYSSLFMMLIVYAMISTITFFFQSNNKKLIRNIRTVLDLHQKRLHETETLIEESQRNMNIGEELIGATDKSLK